MSASTPSAARQTSRTNPASTPSSAKAARSRDTQAPPRAPSSEARPSSASKSLQAGRESRARHLERVEQQTRLKEGLWQQSLLADRQRAEATQADQKRVVEERMRRAAAHRRSQLDAQDERKAREAADLSEHLESSRITSETIAAAKKEEARRRRQSLAFRRGQERVQKQLEEGWSARAKREAEQERKVRAEEAVDVAAARATEAKTRRCSMAWRRQEFLRKIQLDRGDGTTTSHNRALFRPQPCETVPETVTSKTVTSAGKLTSDLSRRPLSTVSSGSSAGSAQNARSGRSVVVASSASSTLRPFDGATAGARSPNVQGCAQGAAQQQRRLMLAARSQKSGPRAGGAATAGAFTPRKQRSATASRAVTPVTPSSAKVDDRNLPRTQHMREAAAGGGAAAAGDGTGGRGRTDAALVPPSPIGFGAASQVAPPPPPPVTYYASETLGTAERAIAKANREDRELYRRAERELELEDSVAPLPLPLSASAASASEVSSGVRSAKGDAAAKRMEEIRARVRRECGAHAA